LQKASRGNPRATYLAKWVEGVPPISTGRQQELKPSGADRTLFTILSLMGKVSVQTQFMEISVNMTKRAPVLILFSFHSNIRTLGLILELAVPVSSLVSATIACASLLHGYASIKSY